MSKLSSITPDDAAHPTPINAGIAADRIAVERVTLTDYRNYTSARLLPEGRNVVLTGANGAGKTNVLEAVSFLAPGRGLRRAKLSDVTRCDADVSDGPHERTWAVAARLQGPDGIVDIGTGIDPNAVGARERRAVRIDGQPEKAQSALALHAAVVWLTPQMDGLFLDGPGGRRRFLDRLIYASDPAHAGRVTAYEQAMRERSRLLADKGAQADTGWLDALEENMVGKGMAVAAARRDMVGRLSAFTTTEAGPFPTAEMSLTGGPEGWLDEGPALAAEDCFRDALREDRHQDATDGRTRTGPHRTDLVVQHGTKGRPAAVCSTGEQKALLIGLVLAHARMQASEQGRRPILLLDEIAAHLDHDRRAALFDLIEALDTQTWMTGTDVSLFEGMRGRAAFFKVTDGAILGAAN